LFKIEIVSNILDLSSFVCATPAFYDAITRTNFDTSYMSVLRLYTLNKITKAPTKKKYVLGAFLFLFSLIGLPVVLLRSSDMLGRSMLKFMDSIQHHFHSPVLSQEIIIIERTVKFSGGFFNSPFVISTAIVDISLLIILVISNVFRTSEEKQEKLNRRFLYVAAVMFAYARALSIMASLRGG
jgi:hypothetical protein